MSTYIPQPINTTNVELPKSPLPLIERLAENTHEIWSAQRIKDGWTFGPKRDHANKHHPCLVPYDQLPDSEKENDRNTSAETLKAIVLPEFEINEPG